MILPALPDDFPVPIMVVAHVGAASGGYLEDAIRRDCKMPVVEAEERQPVTPGIIHVAPPDYHLMVEADHTFSVSTDPKVHNARPSIDVLLISAAEAWGSGLAAVLLTGANADGADGMAAVKAAGGVCLVQDPATAFASEMPTAAIARGAVDRILVPGRFAPVLAALCNPSRTAELP
ncbi:chemotaxis protein CheB [Paramagnetospirillum kuznetsovii]|uniref:protein-glutamate methylesterase n=2 Tax=Paramagnetospirillum kuznetsovii TaxID=2053833 RepID=A0A364P1N4_9PROT|nr:chemotaxis protein CheB [Paramagnetospirillum kuznetsovii]